MNPLQYKFDFWMFIRGISNGFNGTHDKLVMALNLKDILWYLLIFCFQEQRGGDCSWDIYIAHTYTWHWLSSVILIMDIVNHSAGLIKTYHMFAAVIRGMVKLCLLNCAQGWLWNYSDYHFTNSIYNSYCCIWLVVFCYVLLCIPLCVYCKFMCMRMY